jgi:subtilisin family serine protease
MSEKEYIVSLNKGVDYAAFNQEMIVATGAGDIPSRSVDIANHRHASQRNTHYMLTDSEAESLKNDGRVYGVTLKDDPSISIGINAVQTGDFSKTTLDRGNFLNWGMRRMNESTNPYNGVSVTGGYNYTLDGTDVDVVIQDTGIQKDHPEWQDASGVSRFTEIDWYTESGISGTQNANHYRDYHGHGTHVAGTIAGKTYGWAKNAKIYALKVSGLEGSGDSGTGIAVSDCFDVIKLWHNAKPIDPATGVKRPTIVNMSWGYGTTFTNITGGNYRGTPWTGTTRDTAKGMIGRPGDFRHVVRVASVDTDIEELIDAGVHVVIAAGNTYQKIDVVGGDDYNNYYTKSGVGTVYYHRGGSPYSTEAHIVGNVDSTAHVGGLEQKAASSETGPGVSVYAPGTDIMSAMSTTNIFGATTINNPYPANSNFLINNISGTSMAAPQVSGVLALWLQLNPAATPAQGLTFINATAKTAQLYQTGLTNDYTEARSLLGSTNRFAFNKFNSNVQMRLGAPVAAAPAAAATYALSSSVASVNEGSSFTITLTTTNVANETTVPYTITGISSADIGGASLTGNFTVNNNTATATFNVTADATTEGAETFVLTLNALSTTQSVTINDTSTTPVGTPTYAVAPAANNVNEGSALVFNVTTTNVSDATTLYWSVTNAGDFGTSTGSFTITSNAGTFSVTPTADATTEGAETFTASVRTGSVSGTIVATSSTVTINDTSTHLAAAASRMH